MTKEELKQYIDQNIYENVDGDISGDSLNEILKAIVDDGGTKVEANPTGEATTPLTKIKIGETNYNIPQTDTSNLATKQELQQGLSDKQDTIADLEQIRTRADEGHTALQPRSTGQYTENNFVSFDENGGIKDSGCNENSFATAAQGMKADTAVQQVTVGTTSTGAAGSNASVTNSGTSTAPVLDFTIPRGADAVNPFKGYFDSLSDLQTKYPTGETGDFANVYDSTAGKTYRYVWDASISIPAWVQALDSSSQPIEVTPSTATFATGEELINVGIDNDFAGGSDKVAGAEEVKELNERVVDIEDKFTHTEYSWDTFPNSDITNTKKNIRLNGTWITQSDAEFILVSPGNKVRIIVDSTASDPTTGVYAILRDESVSSIDFSENAKFSTADGFTSRFEASSVDVEFIVPFDGHILYHAKESSAGYNNSSVEKQYQEIVEGIDKNVEDLQESVGDIPTIKVDMYGGNIESGRTSVDMTYSNLPKQKGYLQSKRWTHVAATKSAYYELSNYHDYSYIYVVGGSGGSAVFFVKLALPEDYNINESVLRSTYYATGERSTSVFEIESGKGKLIKIPENAVYVYINRVGYSSASEYVPQQFAFYNVYVGFDCINRIEALEEKTDNAKAFTDSYFDSNVVPYDITKSVGNTLIPINIEVDANGHVVPLSIQEKNIQQKAKQFCLTQWTCKGNIPYRGDSSNPDSPGSESGGTFSEGTTITGMPYSSVKEIDKYIGFDVSVLTFMTAVNNPYSLLYTENVSEDNSKSDWGITYHGVNCATYYGTVCSEFSSYATGMSIIIPTHGHKWLAEYAMKAVCLYNQTEDNLKIGDILVRYKRSTMSSMHCMVVVDIIRNSDGHVTSFKVAESTGSHVRFTTRTKIVDSSTTNIVIAYRFIELYKNIGYDDSANEFIDLSLLPNPTYSTTNNAALIASAQKTYNYNNDICTFAGDKACFAEGDLVVLNYNLNNDVNFPYTDIEVYKDDVLLGTYNIVSIDQSELPVTQQGHALKLGTTLLPGDYKARCTNSGSESEYTYFEVIDTSNVTIENDFTKNLTTINFSSANGLPVGVGMTNISGGQLVMRELTDGEVLSGEIKSDFIRLYKEQNDGKDLDDSLELWIKLYFKGKYGRVTAKLPYMNVEE